MTSKDDGPPAPYQPSTDVMKLLPEISGNAIDGLSEAEKGRPRPVFWRADGSTPHSPVMYYFYERDKDNAAIAEARKYRERTSAIEDSDIAPEPEQRTPRDWAASIKDAAPRAGRLCDSSLARMDSAVSRN